MAIKPAKTVTNNWLKAPINVAVNNAFLLIMLGNKKTRAGISPILFGVINPMVIPVITKLNAFFNEIGANFRIRYFHFTASVPQFTTTNKRAIKSK